MYDKVTILPGGDDDLHCGGSTFLRSHQYQNGRRTSFSTLLIKGLNILLDEIYC